MSESQPARPHYNLTFAVLALGATAYVLLQSMVLPALPDFQRDLHASETSVSWILTAYLLSASIATPIIGRLGDMYGKERVLLLVLVAMAVGALMSAIATSMNLLIAGRVVQASPEGSSRWRSASSATSFRGRRWRGASG